MKSLPLNSIEMIVGLLQSHEVSVCSRFYHLAFVNHCNHIRVIDRREAVSNDNGGSSLSGFVESFLDNFLTLHVQSRSGFIKEEDFGISDESSCDGNSLLLSSTQLGTFATNSSGISLHNN